MSIRLSCPSCNHSFALPALPEHRRATCSRCGDVFPVRTYTEQPDEVAPEGRPAEVVDIRPRWPRTLLLAGGAVLLLAAAGIGWAIYDTGRGMRDLGNDPSGAKSAQSASSLAGLGYLRGNSNIVFAIRPEPLLTHAERTQQQPGDVFKQTGLPDVLRGSVEQLGVPLAQIDHLAGGIELGEGEDALRLTLVLVLKQAPADEAGLLAKLKARPLPGKKDRYDAAVGRFGLVLARVSPTVWAFGLDDRDLTAVEKGGHGPGARHFRGDERSGLRGMITSLPADAAVWAVADDDRDWTQKPALKLLGNAPEMKRWLAAAKGGRGGALAVSLGEQPRALLRVRAADAATAARTREYFTARAAELPSAQSGGGGAVAQFEAPFGADTGKLFQRFLADAGR